MEKWLKIKNYNYFISNFGRVKNKNGYVLKTQINNSGYEMVHLYNDKRKAFTIHRLVAIAFLESNSKEKIFVDHKDGDKKNNHYKNLDWVTNHENNKRAWAIGLHEKTREKAKQRMSIIGKKYSKKNGLFLAGLNKSEIIITDSDKNKTYTFSSFREAEIKLKKDRKMLSKYANTKKEYHGYIIKWNKSKIL